MPETDYLKIPQNRVGALIGSNGGVKRSIEKATGTILDIDSDEEKTISIDTAPYLDCSANMEYCDGQWIMTIADFLGYAKSDYGDVVPKYDIYFYKCGATVEKLAVKKNVRCNCLVEMYLDNKLYITDKSIQGFGEYYDEDNEDLDNVTTFYVSLDDGACVDDKFENIFNNSKDEENIFTVDYVINKRLGLKYLINYCFLLSIL